MKKLLSLLLALALVFSLAACGSKTDDTNTDDTKGDANAESVDLVVFAAASMTETLTEIAEMYKEVAPNVNITYNFDSSGKLLTQISEGADCDLFISAAPQQMNAMDGSLIDDKDKNPDGLDLIVTDSRIDLLENKVTLAVPEGNPKGVESFDQLAELLKSGDIMLAIGNSDVPVGQYTEKIFACYGLDEAALTDCLTYGNNVKEVTTQVSEASTDCGIIYATDAYSAGLTVVDSATAEMCGQVIYPAAVLKGEKEEAAQAFLDYLQTADAMSVFESVGFCPANKNKTLKDFHFKARHYALRLGRSLRGAAFDARCVRGIFCHAHVAAKNFKIICAVRGAKSATLFDISSGRDIPFCPVSCRRMRHELSAATGGKPACLMANFFRRICGSWRSPESPKLQKIGGHLWIGTPYGTRCVSRRSPRSLFSLPAFLPPIISQSFRAWSKVCSMCF